ncbi:MAG: 50S ribosomal protein L15 [Candidatus Doudnabacteria bacterium CG10_big_fil_rev_8_21_14_0_10_42_18]|uniref:Large ribosomal subunit protein uL15 n=1 Tax=Candidatus Doudnabacteria bacterium CG10_big_fil_rev_8_21_14_0_10_42_18 TaxID=1974552 RepID=A0A2H0VBI7_9BACT|nr:MAG: 50S ribosomal protein L15 [Candidatus Doudnabacteria bacterium CG10_big_fil_rev_8_21_14_0_10_42_18]
MLKLHELKRHPGASRKRKVVGRGLSSGHGTYSTRGAKGQKARTGHSKLPAGFEGGRQPLIRQLPKSRGFRSLTGKAAVVSLTKLNVFKDGDTVNLIALKKKGLINKNAKAAKILKGEIKKSLTISIPASASVKMAVEKAGGKIV